MSDVDPFGSAMLDAYGQEVFVPENLPEGWNSDMAGWQHTWLRRLAMNTLIPFTRGVGVDVGSQACPITTTCLRIDHDSRFYDQQHLIADMGAFQNLDYVAASHVLEDFEDPIKALKVFLSMVRIGGHLLFLMPHCDIYPKPGEPGCNEAHRYPTWPRTAEEWASHPDLKNRLKIVQLDECAKLRELHPGCFDFEVVYRRET